jgi:hypothetical protein
MKECEGQFIYHDGKHWLVHSYQKDVGFDGSGGGWFASPLFYPKPNEVKVGVGAANWCYVCHGAFIQKPESNVIVKAYQSFLEHLNWCKKIQEKSNCDLTKINYHITLYENLLTEITITLHSKGKG